MAVILFDHHLHQHLLQYAGCSVQFDQYLYPHKFLIRDIMIAMQITHVPMMIDIEKIMMMRMAKMQMMMAMFLMMI